jgi:hypothetical protein
LDEVDDLEDDDENTEDEKVEYSYFANSNEGFFSQ